MSWGTVVKDNKTKEDYLTEDVREIKVEVSKLDDKLSALDKSLEGYRVSLDHHVKMDEKMYEEFKRLNDLLQQNTESLKEHMSQTLLLKDTVMKMDARLLPLEVERIKREAVSEWRTKTMMVAIKWFTVIVGSG